MAHPEKDKKKKVQRLIDVDVSHVSLVDRPANQTPFKFVKRDEGTETEGAFPMNITLKNMFGSRQPEITSVMANTEAKAREVAKSLMTGDNAEISEKDGVFVVRKTGTKSGENEQVIHMGKKAGVAYTVANLQKALALYDGESMNFDETVTKEGFVPGLYTATEALHETIRNIAMDEATKSPKDFEQKVSKALESFNTYISDLINTLPEAAFKFEKALTAVSPNDLSQRTPVEGGFNSSVYDMIFGDPNEPKHNAADDNKGEAEADKKPADAAAAAPAAPEGGTEGGTQSGEAAPKAGEDAKAGKAGEADAGDAPGGRAAADAAPANLEQVGTAGDAPKATHEEALAAAMEGLTKSLGDQIAKAMKPLNDRLDKQDAAIQSVSKAMGSTVATTPDADGDDSNVVDLQKGSGPASDPPLMDTAYRSRSKG